MGLENFRRRLVLRAGREDTRALLNAVVRNRLLLDHGAVDAAGARRSDR
jgi:hypothetical protein